VKTSGDSLSISSLCQPAPLSAGWNKTISGSGEKTLKGNLVSQKAKVPTSLFM
jgi:hypothetical protein